jgi:hypothetical protein
VPFDGRVTAEIVLSANSAHRITNCLSEVLENFLVLRVSIKQEAKASEQL